MKQSDRFIAIVVLASAVSALSGCTPPFPQTTLDRVDGTRSFHDILRSPDAHKGAWVMLGGVIIAVKNIREGTQIEVLHKPIDHSGRPLDTDESEGRFLLVTSEYLDAAVYQTGRLVSAVAVVDGAKTQPLDDIQYTYPVLTIQAIHIWKPGEGPRFYFGIGVSGRI